MSAGIFLYSLLGGLGLIFLIFLLTPAGKRWVKWLDSK